MTEFQQSDDEFLVEELIDEICDAYESAFRAGEAPKITPLLSQVSPSNQAELLEQLLLVHWDLSSHDPSLSEAIRQYPEHAETVRRAFTRSLKPSNKEREPNGRSRSFDQQWIGNYRLLEPLGEGGMGHVWLAEQQRPLRRKVAIKFIRSDLASTSVTARFDAERQALALMDHPNISKVLDAGETDSGTPYFVMEYVEGVSITEYCDNNKLTVDERLALFIPVCKAVQHAHQKGIIHRDLKPSNVLVGQVDGKAVAKVIDFGLAKAVNSSMTLTQQSLHTEYGKVIGTVQYMSPEQANLDSKDIDTRTDIYSLGVVLYELLTGTTPLVSESVANQSLMEVLRQIRESEATRPSDRLKVTSCLILETRKTTKSKLQRALRGELDWIVLKA
ncbi:MAG: serine/threonine-protein kinase, partial [Planctomycetota bacterium]